MIIRDVEAIPIRLPLKAPNPTAAGTVTESRKIIVRITTDSGIAGYGEASTFPAFGGGTAEGVLSAIAAYRPLLAGADPFDLTPIARAMEETIADQRLAQAAINVALHDIVGQSLNQPIYNLLGGKVRDRVEVFLIVGGDTPEQTADAARRALAQGYAVIKIKAGFEPIEATIDKIAAVRDAVGDALAITVDANQAWKVKEAVSNISRMQPYRLQSVEQPVAARDLDGMARVSEAVDVPIIADESVWDVGDALEIIKNRAADVLSVRICKAGGISKAKTILDMAAAAGMPCILGSMLETDLGISASLQLAATAECALNASALSHYLMYDASLLAEPLSQQGSALRIPEGPGLGVKVSERAIERYREIA